MHLKLVYPVKESRDEELPDEEKAGNSHFIQLKQEGQSGELTIDFHFLKENDLFDEYDPWS
jgi:hypothetical protein